MASTSLQSLNFKGKKKALKSVNLFFLACLKSGVCVFILSKHVCIYNHYKCIFPYGLKLVCQFVQIASIHIFLIGSVEQCSFRNEKFCIEK